MQKLISGCVWVVSMRRRGGGDTEKGHRLNILSSDGEVMEAALAV